MRDICFYGIAIIVLWFFRTLVIRDQSHHALEVILIVLEVRFVPMEITCFHGTQL